MLNHIPFTTLADMAEGRLGSDERAASSAHLSACSRCADKLKQLERVLGMMRADETEDAPAATVSGAINLFRARAVSPSPSLKERIVAALSFDSLQMSPAYGVRSSSRGTARQLLFSAGAVDLDLRVTESADGWVVLGQVLGRECIGGRIELEGEGGVVQADLNAQCEFTLPRVPTGSYNLRLSLPDLEVEIPQLELRA
jgi:hypothetical protein